MPKRSVLLLCMLFLAFPKLSHALLMTQGGEIDITFPAPAGNSHLAATATVTLSSLTSSSAVLDILINNNSSGDTGFTDRLTAFGFNMTPTPTANSNLPITFVSGTNAFQTAGTPDAVPSISPENVCAWVGTNCSAGNAGLTAGLHDEFTLTLAGTYNTTTGIDLSTFGIKWTDCDGCSFEILGTAILDGGGGGGGGSVPEPPTLLLLGGGLIGFGAMRHWKAGR